MNIIDKCGVKTVLEKGLNVKLMWINRKEDDEKLIGILRSNEDVIYLVLYDKVEELITFSKYFPEEREYTIKASEIEVEFDN